MHLFSTLVGAMSLATGVAAQKPYRLANCYSFSDAIYPLDLQAIYTDNTLESCANNCAVFGFTFFGVSDGTNCYCGNSVYDDITSPECFDSSSDACPGAPSERCGGNHQMAIYGDPALIGDCPSTPLAGLGAPCATVLAGAAPAGASSSSSSSSVVAPSTADRSGASQTPSVTATPSQSPSAGSTSYISTTDANGSPTLIPTISQASRTGSQDASVILEPTSPAHSTSGGGGGGLEPPASACSPTTLRSALIDSHGRTVSLFPVGPASTPAPY